MWVRFEGPGKLHAHRWHEVTRSPSGRLVTLCGRYVHRDPVTDQHGSGRICGSCTRSRRLREGVSRRPI